MKPFNRSSCGFFRRAPAPLSVLLPLSTKADSVASQAPVSSTLVHATTCISSSRATQITSRVQRNKEEKKRNKERDTEEEKQKRSFQTPVPSPHEHCPPPRKRGFLLPSPHSLTSHRTRRRASSFQVLPFFCFPGSDTLQPQGTVHLSPFCVCVLFCFSQCAPPLLLFFSPSRRSTAATLVGPLLCPAHFTVVFASTGLLFLFHFRFFFFDSSLTSLAAADVLLLLPPLRPPIPSLPHSLRLGPLCAWSYPPLISTSTSFCRVCVCVSCRHASFLFSL